MHNHIPVKVKCCTYVAPKGKTKKSEKLRVYRTFMASPARFERAAFRLGAYGMHEIANTNKYIWLKSAMN